MTKMRESTGVVLWILVLAFGGLWVLQDSGALDNIGLQQRQNIAVVNGQPISYQDYTGALEQEVRAYQQRTGDAAPQAVRDQYADVIYDRLVEDQLRQQEMNRLGIRVTDAEIREMFWGPRYDPLILQLFPDGQGGVDLARLQSVADDPAAEADLVAIEDYLRAKRRAEKLDALLGAAVRVTDAEIEAEYVRRNSTVQAEYVALRYAEIPDDEATVTERDLDDFYDDHREDFKRERTATVDFVSLSQEPSAEDSASIIRDLEALRADFAAAEDDSVFVTRNFSQTPYSGAFLGPNGMEADLATAVFEDLTPGRVVGPVLVGNEARLAKITAVREAQEPAIRAQHILFGNRGDSPEQRVQQLQQANEIKARIQAGESFETLARQYSQDPGSGARGGDLGWFGRGQMVGPFDEAVFAADIGELVGPVETQFGYHLIRPTATADQEVQLAQLVQPVGITSATLRAVQEKAEDLKYYTEDEGGDFVEEAERQGLDVQQAVIQGDQQFIPGLGNSRDVRNFVARSEAGDISDVIDTGTAFVVVRVTDVQGEGYRSLEDVRAEIEPRVRLEKKKAIQVAKLQEALESKGFDGLAVVTGGTRATTPPLSYTNLVVPGLGREPALVGTAFGLDVSETSGAVAGTNAAYVARVTEKNLAEASQMTSEERTQLRNELTTQARQRVVNQWSQKLIDEAEIEDHRMLF